MHIIGIVGTAKNTGKTTTLAALIAEAGLRHERIGVTGIGYDGEEVDTITGLPKPRLMLTPGTIVATSEQCLVTATAAYTVVARTNACTALGDVVIVEITSPGLMVLAGPNTKLLLKGVIAGMEAMGLSAVFVDGSLNRIAAMSIVDTMVFTTGASRAREISFLADEANAVCSLFDGKTYHCDAAPHSTEFRDASGALVGTVELRSLFDAADVQRLFDAMPRTAASIVIPNMVTLDALEFFVKQHHDPLRNALTVVLADPTIAVLAGEARATRRVMHAMRSRGGSIGFRHAIRVAAMTVNPFYPEQHDHTFIPAYINKEKLLCEVTSAVNVPVFNITDDGAASALYDDILL